MYLSEELVLLLQKRRYGAFDGGVVLHERSILRNVLHLFDERGIRVFWK